MKSRLLVLLLFSFHLAFGQNYAEIASQNGMNFAYGVSDFEGGGGISFADFNQDGYDDLTFCTQLGDDLRYFENNRDGTFNEIFPAIPANLGETKQVLWIDYDNDGDKDLFATSYLDINRLYQNNGSFVFTDVTAASGLPVANSYKNHGTYGASFGDYDNDGWLDLYISNYGDGALNARPNHFFKNVNGIFTDITAATGTGCGDKQSFCSIFVDYDNNLTPDLYIANDRVEFSNNLFQNTGNSLIDVSTSSGAGVSIWAMNTGAGDVDNDGDLDLYVTNVGTGNFSNLLINDGGGNFTEEAAARGVEFGPRVGWGGNFLDYDNDNDLDLYVSSLTQSAPNAFYVNQGGGNFTEPLFSSNGLGGIDVVTSFVNAIGDINNDGKLDIAVSNNSVANVMLWENQETSTGNWLKVDLEGTISNRDGISCWIEAYVGGQKLVRYTHSSIAYLAQNSDYHHFGLGNVNIVDSLVVRWPSGIVDRIENVNVNRLTSIIEGSSPIVNALPVELRSFDASTVDDEYIALTWEVESEENFSGYEIQRSIDGRNFEAIGWKEGSDAKSLTTYQFKDLQMQRGVTSYYRLKMVDLDGSFEWSEIVHAHLGLKDGFELGTIYPNPAENTAIHLDLRSENSSDLLIQVYNQTGQLFDSQQVNITSGQNNIEIAAENWTPGLYLIKVSNGQKEEIRKILIR